MTSSRPSNTPLWILVAVFVGIPALCVLCVLAWPIAATIGVLTNQ